jgi:hypothetical protein
MRGHHHVHHRAAGRTRHRTNRFEVARTRIRLQERFGHGENEPRDAAGEAADRQRTIRLHLLRRVHSTLEFLLAQGDPQSPDHRVVHRRLVQKLDLKRYQLMLEVFGSML